MSVYRCLRMLDGCVSTHCFFFILKCSILKKAFFVWSVLPGSNVRCDDIRPNVNRRLVKSLFSCMFNARAWTGKPNRSGKLCTAVYLLVLISLYQLLHVLKILFAFLQNQLSEWGVQLYWGFLVFPSRLPWLIFGNLIFGRLSQHPLLLNFFEAKLTVCVNNLDQREHGLLTSSTLAYFAAVYYALKRVETLGLGFLCLQRVA